jgi:heme/copper-type cytochrome/quinol oxidase subunit 2
MLTYMLFLTVLAYFVIGFLTYSEYKTRFKERPMTFKKGFYIFSGVSLFVIAGVFLIVLGYLILTM